MQEETNQEQEQNQTPAQETAAQLEQERIPHNMPLGTITWISILVVAAVATYFALASGSGWWPFDAIQSNEQKSANQEEITSFEECVEAGYPIMESYPEQCRTPDGKNFVRELSDDEQNEIVTANWHTYRNEEYGFELELTDSFQGYSISDKSDEYGFYFLFRVPSVDIEPQVEVDVFAISAIPVELWDDSMSNTKMYLGKNSKYHFTAGLGQDPAGLPSGLLMRGDGTETQHVLDSFKIFEPIEDIANWQTYRNEEYGFEVRYPEDWVIDTERSKGENEVVLFWDGVVTASRDSIFVKENVENKTLSEIEADLKKNDLIYDIRNITVDSQPAISYKSRELVANAVIVVYNNKIYTLNNRIGHNNQILSTFRFLD